MRTHKYQKGYWMNPVAFFGALQFTNGQQKCYTVFIETFSKKSEMKAGMTIEKNKHRQFRTFCIRDLAWHHAHERFDA